MFNFGLAKNFRNQDRSPNLIVWWVFLALLAAALIADIFFLPLILVILTIVIFACSIFFVNMNLLRSMRVGADRRLLKGELDSLIESTKDGVLIYDPGFKILDLNQAAEKILTLQSDALVGQVINPALIKDEKFKVVAQVIFPSLAPTATQISENSWPQIVDINLENPELRLRTTLIRIANDGGETIGFLKLIHDRTREENILESKNEFITTAAHQLRTPLTAIHWALESLGQNQEKEDMKELTAEAMKSSERALDIINDLLDAAKIEEGKFGYRFEEKNLNDFIVQIIDRGKVMSQSYGVNVYFSADRNYLVKLDPEMLDIAVSNLVDNAVKYNTKNGNVNVVLNAEDGNAVKVSVKDTGVGIPENEVKKLFSKFYRGSNVVQLEPNGSGLGLYITKNIIEGHGGKIGLESVMGRGTTFWFTLPYLSSTETTK